MYNEKLRRVSPSWTFRDAGGFTLVELIVVVGLIALLSAGLGVAWVGKQGNTGQRAAESSSAAIFQAARMQAMLKQARTRVIVLDDPTDEERIGRYLGIVYEDFETADSWIAASDGVLLPDNIRFRSDRSMDDGGFQLRYPLSVGQAPGAGPSWRYYEFDGRGHLSGGAVRVFALGPVSESAEEVTPLGGFAIFPLGGVEFFETREDL